MQDQGNRIDFSVRGGVESGAEPDIKDQLSGIVDAAWAEYIMQVCEPAKCRYILDNTDRVKEVLAAGLLYDPRHFRSLEFYIDLPERSFQQVLALAKEFGLGKIRDVCQYPDILGLVGESNPHSGLAKILLRMGGVSLTVIIFQTPRYLEAIMRQPEPEKWVVERFSIIERIKKILGPLVEFDKARALVLLDERKIEVVEKVVDPLLRKILVTPMISQDESVEQFQQRTDFWQEAMSPELHGYIEDETKSRLKDGPVKLMCQRQSWMQAVQDMVGIEGVRAALQNLQAVRSLRVVVNTASCQDAFSPEESRSIASKKIEIETAAGLEQLEEEVKDILAVTGLDQVAEQVVSKIRLLPPIDLNGAVGGYNRNGNQMILTVSPDRHRRYYLATAMIHEIGHAVKNKITDQRLFDAYALRIVYRGVNRASLYSELYARTAGRESYLSLQEAFAEDFRIFLTEPTLIPEERRTILEQLLAGAFPDIDFNILRQRIRLMYGNYYGIGVKETQAPFDHCLIDKKVEKKRKESRR